VTITHLSDDRREAREWGRMCALAGQAQRDLADCAAGYRGLFAARPFDPGLFATLAFACAYGAPWLPPDGLRVATRTCLWCFGLDWLVDYAAGSRAEVHGVVRACLAVADGGDPAPGDDLARFLADLRGELAGTPDLPALYPVWREELRRMLDAMAREWDWRSEAAAPTVEEYLANADNLGFSFVFTTHLFLTGDRYTAEEVAELRTAGRAVQRVVRLLNDLGTYDRDVRWGDLNVLLLGVTRADVTARIAVLTDRCDELVGPVRARHPELAGYLSRQLGFNQGFYRFADYWGRP
jgi:hypothetical protein